MNEDDFLRLWRVSVIPSIAEIEKHTSIRLDADRVKSVHMAYEVFREGIKSEMLNPREPMDRHKVGACMAYAILKASPFPVASLSNGSRASRLANELLAFNTAMQIVFDFSKTSALQENDGTTASIFSQAAILPQPTKEPYLVYITRTLYNCRIKKEYNVSLFSNTLFVLEKFHEAQVRERLLTNS